MVYYEYECDKCKISKEIEGNIKEGPPKKVVCDKCEGEMHRVWGSSTIHIPDYFKATYDGSSPSEIGRRLNAKRPSGRRKVYY